MTDLPVIDVVVRCRNEMPYARDALEGLLRQKGVTPRILLIDCHSDDGSREVAVELGLEIIDLDPASYVPGRVLNMGMQRTTSQIVAFVNADAIPRSDDALEHLVAPLLDSDATGAVYARQLPRETADIQTKMDYRRAFPDGAALEVKRGTFFSMAGSAISRRAWEQLPFDEDLKYSEDVDWTHRIGAVGWRVVYVPEARFEHSHDYSVRAHFKRRRGEGVADTAIYRLGSPSVIKELARPLVGTLLRDFRARNVSAIGVAARCAQVAGYYFGRREST